MITIFQTLRGITHSISNLLFSSKPHCSTLRQAGIVYGRFNFLHLFQSNVIPNSHLNTLDLVFTSFDNLTVSPAFDPLVPSDLYHPPLQFALPISLNSSSSIALTGVKDFHKADYSAISNDLSGINWDNALSSLSVDESVDILYPHLKYCIDSFLPFKTICKTSYPCWFSRSLISLIKAKKVAHHRFKKHNCLSD